MAANMEVLALDGSTAWSAVRWAGPLALEILEGTVLVTVEGDVTDHVLAAGEVFEGPPRRRVAATGITQSRIRVSPELPTFARLAGRRPGQIARHLFGGALILAVWMSLWTWLAVGVVGPLSRSMPPTEGTDVTSIGS